MRELGTRALVSPVLVRELGPERSLPERLLPRSVPGPLLALVDGRRRETEGPEVERTYGDPETDAPERREVPGRTGAVEPLSTVLVVKRGKGTRRTGAEFALG